MQIRSKLVLQLYVLFFTLTELNKCIPNPCRNGATCVRAINSYSCQCVAGYSGQDCQSSKSAALTKF